MGLVAYGDIALYRRLLGQARPYWPHLAAVLLLDLLSAPLRLLAPLPLKIAVDSGLDARPLPGFLGDLLPPAGAPLDPGVLALMAALVVAITLLGRLQGLALWLLKTYTGEQLVLEFRARLFRHAQRLSLAYHDSRGATDSTYRVEYDAPALRWIAVDGVAPFATAGLTLAGMIYVAARIDPTLALIALAVLPALALLARTSRRRLRARWSEIRETESAAMAVVQEALAAARVVKAFGQEDREQERFLRRAREGVRGHLRIALLEGGFDLLIGLITAAGTAAVLVLGVLHVRSGALTLGDLLLVMAYLAQIYGPLETVTRNVADLQAALASAGRAFAVLDEPPDVVERPRARPLSRAEGAVAFRHVSFGYEPGRPVLRDVSFEIEPGTRAGIVGATGAGKTTLASLLARFYDPTEGQILLDGVDLRDYRLADLRNQLGLVLQEPVLLSASVAENVAYARPGAGEREIVAAARAANAHEFILQLPRGYETPVGERGMLLSGGERQRIALARAFLRDAPILVLDEPTSSVDATTEAAILEAMERLARGRTVFIITHRPSVLRGCDVVLEIDDGRLVAPQGVQHPNH